jgi:DNA-binding protein H-NS
MKGQGMSEGEMINSLTEQGVSPRDINDALKQAQIKNAVSNGEEIGDEMQPSIMPEGEVPIPIKEQNYSPQNYQPQTYQQPAYSSQDYQPQTYQQPAYSSNVKEQYVPQEQQQYYAPEEGTYSPSGVDADTIIEIADQIFSEKIKKFQNQVDASSEMNALLQTRLENVSERLKKIETLIDKLQIAILEKVGSYGQNLESVKKEMSMMQDSFSKMISSPKENKKSTPENYPIEEDAFSKLKNINKSSKKIS